MFTLNITFSVKNEAVNYKDFSQTAFTSILQVPVKNIIF